MSARERRPGALPRVDLLPDSERERMAVRRLRRRFGAGALALIAIVGAGWALQHERVGRAEQLVAVEQAETDRLTSQVQVLAPIRVFVDGVAVQERTISETMAGEVYFSEVLDGIREATPAGAEIAALSVSLTPPAADPQATSAAACPGPDPFNTRAVIGCVTLSGTAASRADVGDLVVALGDSGLFVEPFVNTTTTGDDAADAEVAFSGSVGLSEKAYSGRYGTPPEVPATPGATVTTPEGSVP
jgi:hypothetical protein